MVIFLYVAAIIALASVAAFQIVKNQRNTGYLDVRSTLVPRLYLCVTLMFLCSSLSGVSGPFQLLADCMVAVVSVLPIVASVRPSGRLPLTVWSIPVVIPLMTLYYILCDFGILTPLQSPYFIALASVAAVSFLFIYLWWIWRRLRDVKSVMKSGNVWSFVTLCVDFVYVAVPVIIMSMLFVVYVISRDLSCAFAVVFALLLLFELVAVALRVAYDSAFVILHRHERVIAESMKISQKDMPVGSGSKSDDQYKELYERIVLYFEMSKPYLDGDLTINDVVKMVYSNKVYISKAISHYTGRNFRQFVNYYRVMYSIQLFRSNLEMKVSDLSEKSGFNTVVSYTMAFRLFMNETPSEWCRKERSKILKPKK